MVTVLVKSSLFRQGGPFISRLVSIGALRRSALGVVTARVRYVPSGSLKCLYGLQGFYGFGNFITHK